MEDYLVGLLFAIGLAVYFFKGQRNDRRKFFETRRYKALKMVKRMELIDAPLDHPDVKAAIAFMLLKEIDEEEESDKAKEQIERMRLVDRDDWSRLFGIIWRLNVNSINRPAISVESLDNVIDEDESPSRLRLALKQMVDLVLLFRYDSYWVLNERYSGSQNGSLSWQDWVGEQVEKRALPDQELYDTFSRINELTSEIDNINTETALMLNAELGELGVRLIKINGKWIRTYDGGRTSIYSSAEAAKYRNPDDCVCPLLLEPAVS